MSIFREVQRVLMALMEEMDGFDQMHNVKVTFSKTCIMEWCTAPLPLQVIMATNRADTLDPALMRPGRLDRKVEFPIPDRRQKRLIFQVSRCPSASLTEPAEALWQSFLRLLHYPCRSLVLLAHKTGLHE